MGRGAVLWFVFFTLVSACFGQVVEAKGKLRESVGPGLYRVAKNSDSFSTDPLPTKTAVIYAEVGGAFATVWIVAASNSADAKVLGGALEKIEPNSKVEIPPKTAGRSRGGRRRRRRLASRSRRYFLTSRRLESRSPP